MQLKRDQVNQILNAAPVGANKKQILDGLILKGYDIEGVDSSVVRKSLQVVEQPKQTVLGEAFGDLKQVVTDIREAGQKTKVRNEQAQQGIQTNPIQAGFQTAGNIAGFGSKVIGAALKGGANLLLSDKDEKAVTAEISKRMGIAMTDPLINKIATAATEKYNSLSPEAKANVDAAGGIVAFISEFAGGGAVKKGATAGKEALATTGKKILTETASGINDLTKTAKSIGQKTADFVSPEIDDAMKATLKSTPTSKFDEMVKIGEGAADPKNLKPFEVVGDRMAQATKQLEKQKKSFAEQKSAIINKAKNGLEEFSKPTRKAILDINRALPEDSIAKKIITKLKSVKNKLDADKVIDEIQDMLYKGNKDLTIPKGSSADKQLRKIIGEYNTELKKSLPKAYSKLNEKVANRIKVVNTLNNALGEVVDGVSTRGASLIKQYFSPAGRKTKELFEFIKKETGVDLAQDASLAKYVNEIFDIKQGRSILEGIPNSTSGVIDKVVNFAVEKTGVGEGVRNAVQRGSINKARKLTK